MRHKAKTGAGRVKRDIVMVRIAARDLREPWHAKVVVAVVAPYPLSPVNLIPDCIPLLGYLDDLILIPLCVLMAVRLIPPVLMPKFRAQSARLRSIPASRTGMATIVGLWLVSALFLLRLL